MMLLSISSPEVTFKGFGFASSTDCDNIELSLLSSLHAAIAPSYWPFSPPVHGIGLCKVCVINVDFGKFLKVISNVAILFQKQFTARIDNNSLFLLLSKRLSPDQQLTSRTVQEEGSQQVLKPLHAMFIVYCSCFHSGFGEELQLFPWV